MKAHPEAEDLQGQGCWALANLCGASAASCQRAMQAGSVEAVCSAMRMHRTSPSCPTPPRPHACAHVRAQGAAPVLKHLPHLGRCANRSLAVQAKGCRALAHAAAANAAWSTRVRDAGGVHDVMEAMRVHQVGPARAPPQPRGRLESLAPVLPRRSRGGCPARAVPDTAAPRAPRSAASAHAVTLLLAQSSATVQHEGANFLKVGLPPLPLLPLPLWPWEDAKGGRTLCLPLAIGATCTPRRLLPRDARRDPPRLVRKLTATVGS